MRREISKLKDQEDRYNRAYGEGHFSLDQLKGYVLPIQEKIAAYKSQMLNAEKAKEEFQTTLLPTDNDIAEFAKESITVLQGLGFPERKAIVAQIVERTVATKEKLQVFGFIPTQNINVQTNDRYRQDTPRHLLMKTISQSIPFQLELPLIETEQGL